jgi:CheY-like chemotaxis protein
VIRLRDLGVPPWLITGSLTLVVAQRLVRRLCRACSVDHTPTARETSQLHLAPRLVETTTFKTGAGCHLCGGTGYRGRIGLYEVLPVDATIRDLLLSGAPSAEILRAARRGGMQSLLEEGFQRAAEGLTSLEELLRVVPPDIEADAGTCPVCAHAVDPEFRLCPWCGATLGLPSCGGCGRALEHGWRVCPDCGDRLEACERPAEVPSVLVVDDDPGVRAALEAMLADDFAVTSVADGRTALEAIHQRQPDLVLLDVLLPDTDGYEVTRALRSKQATIDLPVVLITGVDDRATELKGLHAGADDYLAKPLDPDTLLARLRALLRRQGRLASA